MPKYSVVINMTSNSTDRSNPHGICDAERAARALRSAFNRLAAAPVDSDIEALQDAVLSAADSLARMTRDPDLWRVLWANGLDDDPQRVIDRMYLSAIGTATDVPGDWDTMSKRDRMFYAFWYSPADFNDADARWRGRTDFRLF